MTKVLTCEVALGRVEVFLQVRKINLDQSFFLASERVEQRFKKLRSPIFSKFACPSGKYV